ncbi:MAG: dual specificity protein phosphatase family protein [Anaerolineaceae bacterium]|nr:dual specificity protein phosphatase family protein [Anaerolineaceae bacterium]
MKKYRHTRIFPIPNGHTIPGGLLDNLRVEKATTSLDLIMDYRAFHQIASPQLVELDGHPHEHIFGEYYASRLRFLGITNLVQIGLYRDVGSIPPDHAARSLCGFFYWRTCEGKKECILLNVSDEPADLQFSTLGCIAEKCDARDPQPVNIVRDWSPSPPLPACLVPDPIGLHRRFGGDPVTINLEGKKISRRLFISGIDIQPRTRPEVSAVLNLGDDPSNWATEVLPPSDRWAKKGEGRQGMTVEEIIIEAGWVIERLRAGQSVLVHCGAGINRSATIVCAVLILLEGLSAENALQRVREKHPWAYPDSHHWLMLRWLAKK